jgi:hypothetical protein
MSFVHHSDQGVDFRDFVSAKTSDHKDESESFCCTVSRGIRRNTVSCPGSTEG